MGLRPGSWLDVDDACVVRGVDGDWLYALGDANHRALLTHQGKYQARMAGNAIAARAQGRTDRHRTLGRPRRDGRPRARCLRCSSPTPRPPSVGLTAMQAEQSGHRIKTVDVNIGDTVPGANFYADGYRGRARMVVDLDA